MVLVIGVLVGVSCSEVVTLPRSEPTIRGTIRGPGDVGSLLIVAGADTVSCDIHQRAQVQVARAEVLRRSGGSASAADLKIGVLVSAWTAGIILDECPGIVAGTTIVIEDTGS
jgi:hypothetical protein